MRIAVVSDIHGNRTAFEAVLADLRSTAPDLIFHGGDLADGGSSPAEIVDRIRELGWQGVLGNADEMLPFPETFEEFTKNQSSQLEPLFALVCEMAAATRNALGVQRLAWLRALPRVQTYGSLALVHASPDSIWRSPTAEAGDDELKSNYQSLGKPIVVYGHIHRPFIRRLSRMIVANSGSVSLSYDGDPRAAYLLLDNIEPVIRRVEYDVNKELKLLAASGLPHADWVGKILESGRFHMP
jgi:predicted phosphodiesterase